MIITTLLLLALTAPVYDEGREVQISIIVEYFEPSIPDSEIKDGGLLSTTFIWIQDNHESHFVTVPASSLKGGASVTREVTIYPVKGCKQTKISIYAYATDIQGRNSEIKELASEKLNTCPPPELQASVGQYIS